jgi:hypothetical protein
LKQITLRVQLSLTLRFRGFAHFVRGLGMGKSGLTLKNYRLGFTLDLNRHFNGLSTD